MRCRMRCWDIWRCWWPIKKYVPVDSIGIEWRTQEMTFDSQVPPYSVTYSISISPSDATKKDVRIESNNPSIISVDSVESDQVTFTIHNEWDARVRITSLADADISDEYSVSVVTPSEWFAPNNGIFVDVDTEWTATGRKRRTKATAMWDRFTAKVFALDEESEDYVLLEWTHGWDVSKTYVWATNEAYTRAMFTEEVTDKIAREIETLWDNWQIENRFVKFTDETWSMIEQFYSEPLTPETVEALQEVLVNNEIVTPESYTITVETEAMPEGTVINYCINETWTEYAPESDFPITLDFSEPISLSYQSEVIYCWALLDNGNYQFWGTYEDNSVYIEMNWEPLSDWDTVTIDSDTTLKFVWDPPVPERCPASIQYVWWNDTTIEVWQTAAVITNFTTTAECENVDYSNIVAYVRASYNVPSDVATASIDFNENKVYVTWVKAWECTVMFTDWDHSWSNNVTVTAPTPPAYATISSWSENVTMAPGDSVTKRISFSPSDADTSNITWTNSDGNVANGSQQLLLEWMCDTVINANSEWTCTITVSDWTNSYVYNVTVVGAEPESHTMTINIENLPEGADITWEIMDPETGETLEEILVSSFPMEIEFFWGLWLNCYSDEWMWETGIDSLTEDLSGLKQYQINFSCDWYKPLFETVWFDLEDGWEWNYYCEVGPGSDVSMIISFTPIEEPESHTFTINVENLPEGASIDNGEEPLEDFPIILDIPSWWSFNGCCDSHEGDGDLNITIYDKPDWSTEWVENMFNIGCDWYKPSFEAVWFDLEDFGGWSYSFIKDDNCQIVPDSNVSLTISFTPVEE